MEVEVNMCHLHWAKKDCDAYWQGVASVLGEKDRAAYSSGVASIVGKKDCAAH